MIPIIQIRNMKLKEGKMSCLSSVHTTVEVSELGYDPKFDWPLSSFP